MRHLAPLAVILLAPILGCGGGTDDTAEPATCAEYDTVGLSTLTVSEWPAGLQDLLTAYDDARGSWRGTSCPSEDPEASTRVDFRISGPGHDALRIVRSAPDASAACGCTYDPDFAPDNHLQPLALIPDITIAVEGEVDPAVDDQTLTGVGALFQSGSQLVLRVCGSRRSDPFEGSDYDDAHFTFRTDADGRPSATITLIEVEDNLPPRHCNLTDLTQ